MAATTTLRPRLSGGFAREGTDPPVSRPESTVVGLAAAVQREPGDADVFGMNGPGGRATPGLEHAIALLSEGAERPRVLREALGAALRATQATHALLLGTRIGDPVVLGAVGTKCPPLETVTREALAGGPSRRSDPVANVNAAALPVWAGSRVVAALGVAGPADTLDAAPLDTAVDVVSLTLRRSAGADAAQGVAETYPRLVEIGSRDEAVGGLLEGVNRLGGLPAFVCLEEDGRLRVARYQGVERERLTTLVASEEFRSLVQRWRHREHVEPAVIATDDRTEVVGCAPLGRDPWYGLLAIVGGREEIDEVLPSLAAAGTLVAHGLDRERTAAEMERRGRELSAAVDALPSPVLLVEADGRLVRANPPAVELFGLSGDFDRGRSIAGRLGHPDVARLVGNGDGEALVELGTPSREYAVRARMLSGGDRQIIVLTDASAERERTRATEEFVSVMGHELRTPLTVVQGALQTVTAQGDAMNSEDRETLLTSAVRQSTHLGHLIEDLLLMSTEAGGRPPLNLTGADLLAVATDTVEAVAAAYSGRSVDVVPVGDDFSLTSDPARLGQVIRHLVDNALRHTEGPVTVEVSGVGDPVEVAVTDQGDGIYSGDVERMFEAFVQRDSSSTRRSGGTGIGLYLARRLVEAMGGKITCDSRLGQGTRFLVRLPRRAPTVGKRATGSREVTTTRDHASS